MGARTRTTRPRVLKRIGVLGDIHAEDAKLEVALDVFKRAEVERVLATGDVVDGRGDLNRCCNLLEESRVVVVKGNHERWFLEGTMRDLPDATPVHEVNEQARDVMQQWPATVTLETVVGPMLLCHGLLEDDMNRLLPDDSGYALEVNRPLQFLMKSGRYSVVINGHTHRRMVRSFGPVTIINAGTLFADHLPCFAIVDFSTRAVQFTNFTAQGELVQDVPVGF